MTTDWQDDMGIPGAVRKGLDRFCKQLQDALGEQLVSVVLYGGLARGEYSPASSNVNVMVVLRDVTVEALDRVAPPVRQAERDLRVVLLLLTEEDLRRSTDVFPIKFLDMQRNHQVLRGKDVLSELHIAPDHLRLRCEQEIKNLLLRLRQFYLQRAQRPEFLESTLSRAAPSLLASLSVLVEFKGGPATTSPAAVVEAAERIGLDSQPLRHVLAMKRGELKPNAAELKQLYDSFMRSAEQAAALVDKL